MRLFGVELTNKSPEEQSQPSSPVARDFTRPEGAHQPSSSGRRASRDFVRQQGESSTDRGGQHVIRDFTRHFAQNPHYHQAQGEASRRQYPASSGVARWWRSQEAQRHPEQPLPDEASRSLQQPQGDLHPHAHIDDIQKALQFSINELERHRSSVPPHTEHMAQQPEEMLLSHDEMATVPASDSRSGPSQSNNRKRKHDEASSSRVQAALDSTIPVNDLAPQQQAQSDQAGHEQQSETIVDVSHRKRERNYKREYQTALARAAKQGTTLYAMQKARAVKQGTTPSKKQYKKEKAKLAKQGTTPGKELYKKHKELAAKRGTTVGKMYNS